MHPDTVKYNKSLAAEDRRICDLLAVKIDRGLPEAENKIWHAHPVWFLEGNPFVGDSKLKGCVRLLFWSGQSFAFDNHERPRQASNNRVNSSRAIPNSPAANR